MTRRAEKQGRVSLVGAGPGDPDLLTLGAARALEGAGLVLFDALVPREVLAMARGLAVSVGKRAGKASWSQEAIIRLMIRAARSGRRVVRLKCGDPFVFGRGGEELLALRDAGIEVDVVPGVSSAVAAAASAGVPVTHRGLASSFIVLTGQPDATWRDVVKRLAPGGEHAPTLVFLMSVGARQEIARTLMVEGWLPELPVVVVLGATHARSWRWVGTVERLRTLTIPDDVADLPGTLVVGKVAALASPDAFTSEHVNEMAAYAAGRGGAA